MLRRICFVLASRTLPLPLSDASLTDVPQSQQDARVTGNDGGVGTVGTNTVSSSLKSFASRDLLLVEPGMPNL